MTPPMLGTKLEFVVVTNDDTLRHQEDDDSWVWDFGPFCICSFFSNLFIKY